MENYFLKKKLPKLIIVEGLWGTGKTNFINNINKFGDFKVVLEPDHINLKIDKGVSGWYFKEHKRILNDVIKDLNRERIIMDRSIISSAAYQYATKGSFNKDNFLNLFNLINSIDDFVILFFSADRSFLEGKIKDIKNEEIKNLLLNNRYFYKKYIYFYKNILPKYFNKKIIYLKVNKGKKFKKKEKLISLFISNFKRRHKIRSICAASLAYYKNKVLLLYDYNYNHYVIPQGHKKNKEKITDTALRELSEESGYINLKLIKKIKKYYYHYYKNDDIIFKEINVFLVKIINKKQVLKKLEEHENYSNHFFTINKAIEKARWKEDKDIIKESKVFINKNSS
jgi:hypothetical protein